MKNRIVWGLPRVFAVFLIAAASGALNAVSAAPVFGQAAQAARLDSLHACAGSPVLRVGSVRMALPAFPRPAAVRRAFADSAGSPGWNRKSGPNEGRCRRSCRAALHPAVGREHDLGPGLDRARAGRRRELETAPRTAGSAALRRREHPPVPRPEPRDRHRPGFLSTLPYVATILVLISRNHRMQKVNFPASLAKPFRPGH